MICLCQCNPSNYTLKCSSLSLILSPPAFAPFSLCLREPGLAALLRFFNLGAGVPRRYEGTTGKWTEIGLPATLINKPGPIWQGNVIRSFGCCVQHEEIVWPGRLTPLLIVRFLVQLLLDKFTLSYFAHNFALKTPSP